MLRTSLTFLITLYLSIIDSINSQCIKPGETSVDPTCSDANYSFNYASGGSDWPAKFTDCGKEDIQSPISINDYLGMCDASLTFYAKYPDGAASVTLKTDYFNNTMYFDFSTINYYLTDLNGYFLHYTSEYAYFRNPSEHKLNDIHYDVEMQVQAKLATGYTSTNATRLYVSYMFTTYDNYNGLKDGTTSITGVDTAFNTFLDSVNLSYSIYTLTNGDRSVNFGSEIGSYIGNDYSYFMYQGTTNVPVCKDQTQWVVIDKNLLIKDVQKNTINAQYKNRAGFKDGNTRERQTVGDRTLKKGGKNCNNGIPYILAFFCVYIVILYFIYRLL